MAINLSRVVDCSLPGACRSIPDQAGLRVAGARTSLTKKPPAFQLTASPTRRNRKPTQRLPCRCGGDSATRRQPCQSRPASSPTCRLRHCGNGEVCGFECIMCRLVAERNAPIAHLLPHACHGKNRRVKYVEPHLALDRLVLAHLMLVWRSFGKLRDGTWQRCSASRFQATIFRCFKTGWR